MAYLNLDLDYFDHPKTIRLVGLLGKGADLLPIRLWCYCGKYHAETGELIGYSPLEIETVLKWWGPAGRAAEVLEQSGFVERTENGFKVHDWERVNGHIAALKERAQAGAQERWKRYRYAQAMLKQCLSNATSNAPSLPSLPIKNKKKKVKNTLAHVDPGNLAPAHPDPPNVDATLASVQKASEFTFLGDDTYPYLKAPEFSADWAAWLDMRRKMRIESTPRSMVIALNKLHQWPLKKAVLSLQLSIERAYRGIFEPKEDSNGKTGSGWGHRRPTRADEVQQQSEAFFDRLTTSLDRKPDYQDESFRPGASASG